MAQTKTINKTKNVLIFLSSGIKKNKSGALDEKKVIGEGHGFESRHKIPDFVDPVYYYTNFKSYWCYKSQVKSWRIV